MEVTHCRDSIAIDSERFAACCRFSLAQDGPYLMRDRVGYNQTNMLLPIGLVRQFMVSCPY